MKFNSFYLHCVFRDPAEYKKLVETVAANVKKLQARYEFDAIAFTGASGSAMAYPISMMTGIPIIYVRKDAECMSTHGIPIEGPDKTIVKKFAVIDDLISSGSTVERVVNKLKDIECVCVMLYNDDNSRPKLPYSCHNKCPVYKVNLPFRLPRRKKTT